MDWDFPLQLPDRAFDGFIFDCDGTLIDSMPLHWRAWVAALRDHGAPFEFTEKMHHDQAGMSIPESVQLFNQRFGCALDAGAIDLARTEYFFSHLDELRVVHPVVNLALAHAGAMPMAVASGSGRLIVERELRHLGLRDLFPVVITADDVSRSKPAPDLFLLAAAKLGVAPDRCLVFEDGHQGLLAAAAAGMQAIYIPTNDGGRLHSSAAPLQPIHGQSME